MTATTVQVPQGPTLDVSATPGITMSRLIRVELRKLVDTRAGLWLLIAIGAITAAVMVIFTLNSSGNERTFMQYVGTTATPQAFLLPVLGILLVTSEWSQRTAMVTFTLEPHRGRVIGAKVAAAIVAGFAAIVLAVVLAALATAAFGGAHAWTGLTVSSLGRFALLQVSGVLEGLAFGLLLLNSASAIVLYFVLPLAFTIVTGLWTALDHVRPWLDLGASQPVLYSGLHITGSEWAHLATSSALWIVLPFLLGLWRVTRAEVK